MHLPWPKKKNWDDHADWGTGACSLEHARVVVWHTWLSQFFSPGQFFLLFGVPSPKMHLHMHWSTFLTQKFFGSHSVISCYSISLFFGGGGDIKGALLGVGLTSPPPPPFHLSSFFPALNDTDTSIVVRKFMAWIVDIDRPIASTLNCVVVVVGCGWNENHLSPFRCVCVRSDESRHQVCERVSQVKFWFSSPLVYFVWFFLC